MISSSIQYFGFVFLLVYVGAISILFLFILMLFDLSVAFQHRYSLSTTKKTFSGIFLLGVIKIYFIFVDAVESFHHFCGDGAIPLLGRRILHSIYFEDNDSFQVSLELYKSYGLSYFFIVMLLLSAMLGSIIIAMYASSGTFRRYGFYNRLQVPLFTNLSNANFLAYSLSTFLSLDFTFKKVLLEVKSFSNPDDVLFNNLQRLNWYA
jgi:NADH:ubiquinone oxidoreductase subunit 6 (subunit J)